MSSILIVAGEASADLHGTALVKRLKQKCTDARLWGIGGEGMRNQGFETLVHAESISVAGLTEVLSSIPRIGGYLRHLKREAKKRRPQLAILLDLPDFNLRLAKYLKKLGIPVLYFISPQVWAWRAGRVKTIAQRVDRMLCILPFEVGFYEDRGVQAYFVGHPLAELLPQPLTLESAKQKLQIDSQQRIVGVLPGSRQQEVARLFPIMVQTAEQLLQHTPDLQFLVPKAVGIQAEQLNILLSKASPSLKNQIRILDQQSDAVIQASDVVLTCSGTATLQTALLGRPMVVCYKTSALTYYLVKKMATVNNIALPNFMLEPPVIPEYIQSEANPERLSHAVRDLLDSEHLRSIQTEAFKQLRQQLHNPDGCIYEVAEHAQRLLKYGSSAPDSTLGTVGQGIDIAGT